MTTIRHEYVYIGARNPITIAFTQGGDAMDLAGALSFDWALVGTGATFTGNEVNNAGTMQTTVTNRDEVSMMLGIIAERDAIPAGDYEVRLAMNEFGHDDPFQLIHEQGPFRLRVTVCATS